MEHPPFAGMDDGTPRKDPEKDFQLMEKLGEGSYGSVWKAMHKQSSTIVAVKKVAIDNDLEDIVKEIDFMRGCQSPYIVRYYGSYFKDSELWIIMEFCGAGSVCDIMKICDKTLTEEQIAVVSKDVLNGLFYLHGLRKIHRDIKAGNILLNNNGASKLADFGVSGQLSDTMAKRQTVIGTPFWMAPEVIQEVGYDEKAIFMIPSRPPPHLTEQSKWSTDFNDFVGKCLTKNPDLRPSAKELLEHPFIQKAKSRAILQVLLDQQEQAINLVGRDAALGILKEGDDDSDEEDEDSEDAGTVRKGTVARVAAGSDDEVDSGTVVITDDDKNAYGTMVVTQSADEDDDDGSATMKKTKKETKYVPPFLDHFKKQQETPPAAPPAGNPKFANFTLEQLKKMIIDLDAQKEREIESIREKYSVNKRSIIAAIDERKTQK